MRNRRLFCARDAMGVRPFFYCQSDKWFLFSLELAAIFEHPDVSRKADELTIADVLSGRLANTGRTLFAKVSRLPPATVLTAGTTGVKTHKYSGREAVPLLRDGDDREYAEHFISLFEKIVKAQLRSQTPIGIMVSRGLDSSTVTGIAHHLLQSGSCAARLGPSRKRIFG